jgi:hypothetical protein
VLLGSICDRPAHGLSHRVLLLHRHVVVLFVSVSHRLIQDRCVIGDEVVDGRGRHDRTLLADGLSAALRCLSWQRAYRVIVQTLLIRQFFLQKLGLALVQWSEQIGFRLISFSEDVP